MKRKNVISFISVIIVLILLAGCGKSNEVLNDVSLDTSKIGDTGGLKLPFTKEPVKITIFVGTSVDNINDLFFVKELRKRTGLDIEIIPNPVSTVAQKAKILLASKNNMPNIFAAGLSDIEVNSFGVQGAFEPINKHINELPNFKSLIVDDEVRNKKVLKGGLASDGNLYTYPSVETKRLVNHGMLYRKDIFDKHGIKAWENGEEFHMALKKLKELYPNSTPYTSKTLTSIFNQWGQSWGLNVPDVYFDEEDNQWKYSAIDPKYKDMLDYMKKLYDENLIDPEFLTLTQNAWTQKMTAPNQAFTTLDWIGRLDMFHEQSKAAGVEGYDLRYGLPIGPTGKVVTLPETGAGTAVAKNENALFSLKILDYLLSPSGAELLTMGVEGVTYEMDDKGFAKYIGFDEEKVIGITDLEEKYGMFIGGLYRRFDKRSIYFNYTEKEKEAQDLIVNENRFLPEDPVLVYSSDEMEMRTNKVAKLNKAAEEFAVKYILTNETGDSAWDAWCKEAEGLGVKDIEAIANQAHNRIYSE